MARGKDTAHRPSQSDQEFVLKADGTKVRNTAYVPRNSSLQSLASGKLRDIRTDSSSMTHHDVIDIVDNGTYSLNAIADNIMQGNDKQNYSDIEAVYDMVKNVAQAYKEADSEDYEELMNNEGYKVNSASYDQFYKYEESEIFFEDVDSGYPTNVYIKDNKGKKTVSMSFDDNDSDVKHIEYTYENGELEKFVKMTQNDAGTTLYDIEYSGRDTVKKSVNYALQEDEDLMKSTTVTDPDSSYSRHAYKDGSQEINIYYASGEFSGEQYPALDKSDPLSKLPKQIVNTLNVGGSKDIQYNMTNRDMYSTWVDGAEDQHADKFVRLEDSHVPDNMRPDKDVTYNLIRSKDKNSNSENLTASWTNDKGQECVAQYAPRGYTDQDGKTHVSIEPVSYEILDNN